MKMPSLNNREQLLLSLCLTVLLWGSYGYFRFYPAHKVITEMTQSADATEQRLKTSTVPDEPTEDIEKLTQQLADQERAIEAIKAQVDAMEQRLAPADSRETIVGISQLAQDSQVRIRINELFKTPPPAATAAPAVAVPTGKKAKRNAAKASEPTVSSPVILPNTAGWVARLSSGTLFGRPQQHIELEGSYTAIRQFIHGLEELPYQVTVLRMQLEKQPTLAPPGYPQLLVAELVLAL